MRCFRSCAITGFSRALVDVLLPREQPLDLRDVADFTLANLHATSLPPP
jgi:hypothetical protein